MDNKENFKREIKYLRIILADSSYWVETKEYSSQNYKTFLSDMHTALVSDRTITDRMKSAINKAIKTYCKRKDPKFVERLESIVMKLKSLLWSIKDCGYTLDYEADRTEIIQSMIRQVYAKGTLTVKQFTFCNKMHSQFRKRIEKVEKST
jgi:hypothetical protein